MKSSSRNWQIALQLAALAVLAACAHKPPPPEPPPPPPPYDHYATFDALYSDSDAADPVFDHPYAVLLIQRQDVNQTQGVCSGMRYALSDTAHKGRDPGDSSVAPTFWLDARGKALAWDRACDVWARNYDYDKARGELDRLANRCRTSKQVCVASGSGPILLAHRRRGEPVYVIDLSAIRDERGYEDFFLVWKREMMRDPLAWSTDRKRIREKLRRLEQACGRVVTVLLP